MNSAWCLRGGTVVRADGSRIADVLAVGERIAAVGPRLNSHGAREVDATGMLLLPGGVDVHTHLDTPFMGTTTIDDYRSGSIAAACGGTTTFIDFAFQQQGWTLGETLQHWHAKAEGKASVDYGFHVAAIDLYDGFEVDIGDLVREGVPSLKVFMAYKGSLMVNDGDLFKVLRAASRQQATMCVHAENGSVIDVLAEELAAAGKLGPRSHALSRPPETEHEAVRRAIAIAGMADAPLYLVHLSTSGAVEAVQQARAEGRPVTGETCPHYLFLGEDRYVQGGFDAAGYVVSPPLRDETHQAALWQGLERGVLSVVSSDHCPFCMRGQKTLGADDFRKIPNGAPGIEHRLLLLYGRGVRSGRLSLERFVDLVATTPAKTFGLHPRKGELAVGADADIVVLDPQGQTVILAATQQQASDYTPFEGWRVPGRIRRVFLRGRPVVEDGRFIGRPGEGRFLQRGTA
jgi:dihydropyrimidinase